MEHRIGGLEKLDVLGTVSYDPDNHHRMSLLRAEKVARIATRHPATSRSSDQPTGDLLVLGWGSTYGAIRSAVERLLARGLSSPTPTCATSTRSRPTPGTCSAAIAPCSSRRSTSGQLRTVIRSEYLVDAIGFNLVRGKPFTIGEIEAKAEQLLGDSVRQAR